MSQHSGPFQNLFQGVVRWADEYTPLRFTARQADVYAQNIRAYASTGMRLECDTDASAMRLAFRVFPGSMHDLYCFDLTVDGELFAHREGAISEQPQGEWQVLLPAGEKRIALYLPNFARTEISALSLEGASFARPVRHEHRLLCLGDSITQGYTGHFPSMHYAALLTNALDAELINQGFDGETFRPETLDALPCRPTIITVALWDERLVQKG